AMTKSAPAIRVIFGGFLRTRRQEVTHRGDESEEKNMQKVLRLRDVIAITGLAASTIYKHISLNQFPKAVPLAPGCRAVGWLESEIAAHQKRCAAERDTKKRQKKRRA